ncbi:MAG: glycerol-3-phosphate 1-O-acyltransferase [Gammaproteobacteria bacterium]|nr:glycerol-3-phosphate 1-O-acyltransferase [Gammaproteobacteria bacterium]
MSLSAWPDNVAGDILFLMDAAHDVEREHLNGWLERDSEKQKHTGNVERVVVPIAASPERIPTRDLLTKLHLPAETLVIPVRVVWLKALDVKNTTPRIRDLLFGTPRHPGRFKARRILKNHPMRAKCVSGKPATLGELTERLTSRLGASPEDEQLAEFIAGQASIALDLAERRLRGSRYKVPRSVAQNLSASREFTAALEELSKDVGRPVTNLKTEAAGIFKELISVPQAFWLDVSYVLNRKVSSLGYKAKTVINEEQLNRVRQISKEHPTAILCTHKSHIDFPALNAAFFENDFPALHTFGGVNMAFAGVGFLARRAGVIFIRRSFQDDPLYKLILRQYIAYLMEKRFPLSWAFEGTRSRVGKLMPPKYGILKYVIEAANANDSRDLHIVPLAINYDLISDVRDYAAEQSGHKKRPESLSWFVSYWRSLKRPMGQIYMDFGEPIVLEKAPSGDDRLALAKVALKVGVEVNRVTPLTLTSVATMMLLGSAPRALTRDELRRDITRVMTWALERNIKFTRIFKIDNEDEVDELGQVLIENRLVTRYDDGPDEVYAIKSNKHAVASYYRNTTIHHFVNKAIAELALLSVDAGEESPLEAFWQELDELRDLFKYEFFYTPRQEFYSDVRQELRRYAEDWEESLAADAEYANTLLLQFSPLVAHATLTQFVEAYYVVAKVALATPPETALQLDDCVRRSFEYGKQAYLQRRISSEASIGKLLFQNGYQWLDNKGLTGLGGDDLTQQRSDACKGLHRLMRRLQQIQSMALPVD